MRTTPPSLRRTAALFTMKLPRWTLRRPPSPRSPSARPTAPDWWLTPMPSPPAAAAEANADLHGACGWFGSSDDLQRGLVVQEHATPDAIAGELPLASWLDLTLSGWQPDDISTSGAKGAALVDEVDSTRPPAPG